MVWFWTALGSFLYLFIYIFFYQSPLYYLLGLLKDVYAGFKKRFFIDKTPEKYMKPLSLRKLKTKKSTPLFVYLHGLFDVPHQWHRYYESIEKEDTAIVIYAPYIAWHTETLIHPSPELWNKRVDFVREEIDLYLKDSPDSPVIVYSTSYGSIYANHMILSLSKKYRKSKFFWYSISGADVYGCWYAKFKPTRWILSKLLPPVVIDRLAGKTTTSSQNINDRKTPSDCRVNKNVTSSSLYERYDPLLLFNPNKSLGGVNISYIVGNGHSYLLERRCLYEDILNILNK